MVDDQAREVIARAVYDLARRASTEADPDRAEQLAATAAHLAQAYGALQQPDGPGRPRRSAGSGSAFVQSLRAQGRPPGAA